MSLDDENPTQYFGADAVLWKHPDTGDTLSLSPAQARHAARRYFATLPMDNGPLPDTGHRKGCAFGRTARCTCTYLAQWDKHPDYTAPAFSGGPDKPALHLPVVIATGGDPAELAEKIIRQNPEYFGHIDPEGIYRPSESEKLSAEHYRKDRDKALKMYDHQYIRAEYWKKHGLIATWLGIAGWAFAIARGVWGF
jgi:hypothetical protein